MMGPRDDEDECFIVYEHILKQWVAAEVGARLGLTEPSTHYTRSLNVTHLEFCIVAILASISIRSICTLAGSVIANR